MLKRDTSKRNVLPGSTQPNATVNFSNEKFQEAKRIFAKYDKDGVGSITEEQLLVALKDFGHDEETAHDLVKNMKLDNKKMTFTDFVNNLPVIEQHKFNTITEILSTTMKKKVSDDRMLRARQLFSKYDLDGSGSIDRDELEKIFEEIGQKPSEELMQRLDPDGSGNITFMEFVNAFDIWNEILSDDKHKKADNYKGSKVKLTQKQMAEARATFSKYDVDGDGTVSSKELFVILKNLLIDLHSDYEAEKQAKELMGIIDADGDGNITFIEFVKGYELWIQVEAANQMKKKIEEEINVLKSQINDLSARKKETAKHYNKSKEELELHKAKLQDESDARMKLERELWTRIQDELKYSDDKTRTQTEFRDVYHELGDLSLLNMKSKEFYTKMQFYISNTVKKPL